MLLLMIIHNRQKGVIGMKLLKGSRSFEEFCKSKEVQEDLEKFLENLCKQEWF